MDRKKLYDFIAEKKQVSSNCIGAFVSGHPECTGALQNLINAGYVEEKGSCLYCITDKVFEEADNDEDDGHDTDWGRGDRDHLEEYDYEY